MTTSIMQVARTLGVMSNWSLSNLEMQKICYISEMIFLGRTAAPLIFEDWQAWNYGPVQPDLYHKVKVFGNGHVKDIFHAHPLNPGTPEYDALKYAFSSMRAMTPGQMVSVTHRPNGAWAKHYKSSAKGVRIPKHDIADEYKKLIDDK